MVSRVVWGGGIWIKIITVKILHIVVGAVLVTEILRTCVRGLNSPASQKHHLLQDVVAKFWTHLLGEKKISLQQNFVCNNVFIRNVIIVIPVQLG